MDFIFLATFVLLRMAFSLAVGFAAIGIFWVVPIFVLASLKFRQPMSFFQRAKFWMLYAVLLIAGLISWAIFAGLPGSGDSAYFMAKKMENLFLYAAGWSPPSMALQLVKFGTLRELLIGSGLFCLSALIAVRCGSVLARSAVLVVAFATGPIVLESVVRDLSGLPEAQAEKLGLTCVSTKSVRAALGQTFVRLPYQRFASAHGVARLGEKVLIWSYSEMAWIEYRSNRGDPDETAYGRAPEPVPKC